jgi:hypothetical protein
MEQLGGNWKDFREILVGECFSKICRKNSSFIQELKIVAVT